jgi:SAM-dependent methyltransferase
VGEARLERQSLGAWVREHGVILRKRIALLVPPTRLLDRLGRRPLVKFVRSYLEGLKGIEIGAAAHNDFRVDALNVDRYASMDTVYKRAERKVCGRAKPVDIVAPGHDLPLQDDSVDFVLASHVLEHIPDPIAALREWVRVAREYVVLIVPHRDRTFDRDRPLTPLSELIERHETGFSSEEDRHWSVWTCETFLELCDHLGLQVLEARDPDRKNGNGFAVVLSARTPRDVTARSGTPRASVPAFRPR